MGTFPGPGFEESAHNAQRSGWRGWCNSQPSILRGTSRLPPDQSEASAGELLDCREEEGGEGLEAIPA
jgi:hypothetical protein